MRVIAGSKKGTKLKTIKGLQVRPTTDRIKETLFNILNPFLVDAIFLDLFSGSGAIAIEALSRGAKQAILVEKDKQALECIRSNLAAVKLEEKAKIIAGDVFLALNKLQTEKKTFDLIFLDPPYEKELEKQVLAYLSNCTLIHKQSWIIVESSIKTEFSYVSEMGFIIDREKCYKTNKHVFLSKKTEE
mgnify:CR=1 FL=1